MNRVARRSAIVALLILLLVGGVGLFLYRYAADGSKWANFSANPHLYSNGKLTQGTVTDRNGTVLLSLEEGWRYSQDGLTRMSTLHWLGDRQGYIAAGLIGKYSQYINGYETFSGLYSYAPQGGTLELTLDARLQNAALEALEGRRGTVAIYNYKTGEILCAVTSPTFDPDHKPDIENDPSGVYTGVYVNRFLQSTYTPGSVFKLVTTAAALETVPGIRDMVFTCTGSFVLGPDQVTCGRAHGDCDLELALANSCNCAFAQIALLVGRENMTKYVESYALTEGLTLDGLTGAKGSFDVTDAADIELAWSGIGQYTDQINPCRYLAFVGNIAAGGTGAAPYLVRSAGDGYAAQTQLQTNGMNSSTAALLAKYMKNNTDLVYGQENFGGLTVCAKSGTAEVGEEALPHALFTGFVSDESCPVAFFLLVENSGYGSSVCVPVLAKILSVLTVS